MSANNSQKDTELPQDFLDRIKAICDELNALRDAALDAAGLPQGKVPEHEFGIIWTQGMSPQVLAETIVEQAEIAVSDFQTFKQGHVYCYSCKSSACDHAAPSAEGEVFMGYQNHGEPIWQEFFNALNALEDERVAQIFDDRPRPLARLIGRKRLIAEQFVGGGRNSMTYRVIGQVLAGYFRVEGQRCALTIQAVEDPRRDLHLQIIASDRVLEAMADAPGNRHNSLYRIHDAIQELRHRLRELNPGWKLCKGHTERNNVQERIFTALRHLVHVIERKGKQSNRRTKHAHERSKQNRPVHTASDDLSAATSEDFFLDRARQSVIVMGRRGRAHVFNKDGRHVTTLSLPQDKLDRRVQRKRYAPMSPEDSASFLAAAKAFGKEE